MSVITAIGSDGESLIYLEGEGLGTFANPFKPKYVADGGNHYVAGIATQEEELTAITSGSESVVKLDPTGRMYVNQKSLTSVKDSVTSHQGGAWTAAVAGIATQEEELTAITAGSELIAKLDPTGRLYVSQKPLTSVKDSVTSHQGGAWTAAVAGIATQEEELTAVTAGSELIAKLDPTGRLYVSQKPLTSVKDSVTSHQGGSWTVAIEQSSVNALTVLPSDAAKASNQSRIPGLDIPKHDWIQIVEDSAGELISVTYKFGDTVVSTLNFTYSDYTFVGPNRTTTIEKS